MRFAQIPTIPAGNIYRAALVSSTCGNKELKRLEDRRLINPVHTKTGRVLLSPADGETVFDALAHS